MTGVDHGDRLVRVATVSQPIEANRRRERFEVPLDLAKLVATGQWICSVIGKEPQSKAARAIAAKQAA
jgi:hypothetical protein